jgi:hypothetical protein
MGAMFDFQIFLEHEYWIDSVCVLFRFRRNEEESTVLPCLVLRCQYLEAVDGLNFASQLLADMVFWLMIMFILIDGYRCPFLWRRRVYAPQIIGTRLHGVNPEDHRTKVWLFCPITLLPNGKEYEDFVNSAYTHKYSGMCWLFPFYLIYFDDSPC